ncbi:MAG: hypothetical protein AMJ62_10150 [Myxococcales bacterium SG8_38]|nr:MAG: hypothetical protein AMJ62_10150 [Myxococcales bacterium SG8_38]
MAMGVLGCKGPPPTNPGVIAKEPNVLLWGDTHVHTSFSPDARELGTRSADPNTAYNWAKGLPVVHPYTQARVQLERPLDFVIVTDHAEGLEETKWNDVVEAAERHYAPCLFTTFIGWEWTSEAAGRSLHRIVFMNEGAEQGRQLVPFSARDSQRPEDLWSWLEETSNRVRTDFIAIPHNPNLSGGMMFAAVDSEGMPITAAYSETRMRWEPVAEVTQIKGDSETHPALSPDDEFADFERFPQSDAGNAPEVSEGSYARSALLRGLKISQAVGANPFELGMIGSSGSHTGLASVDEADFLGAPPSQPDAEKAPAASAAAGLDGNDLSAQGLTAVWAEENTRTSIFEAFKRKEVYATTGPRIRVRFFGGWDFDAKQARKADMVNVGYTFGYPMGSDLKKAPKGKAPSFLMYAVKDPEGANLDRIQLVKGWVDAEGKTHEKVYDVSWSGGRARGPDGKLPAVFNTVDLATARYEDIEGSSALRGFWSDPEFDPDLPAFYYLRVLQVPTPRHSLYDAVALGIDPGETGHPPTIQERAYTSPIWYTPESTRR